MGEVLTKAGRRRLLRDVAALIEAGRAEAQAAVGHALALTYHRVGARVLREGLSERAGYGNAVLEGLAEELGLDRRTVFDAVRFAREYPQEPEAGLSWTHYRQLLAVAQPAARGWYEARVLSEGWSKRALTEAIRGEAYEGARPARKGGKGKGAGKGALLRPREATYVYGVEVLRVIDGDTVVAAVDLGFSVTVEQRLRLANVDAPDLKTAAGKAARDFVVEALARAPSVVVKTVREDLHGRYVGHVMYAGREMPGAEVFEKGQYLNQALVDAGHAVVV